MIFNQIEYDIKCEWGLAGIEQLALDSDAFIIVDVLSFSTCVSIAIENDAVVYPYKFKDETASEFAASKGAVLASPYRKATEGYSLSPSSLLKIPKGTKLVLPFPNGATLSLATSLVPSFAGCLRNAQAVAEVVQTQKLGSRISVIPAGERWPDGGLRPSFEDLVGAGAIISYLSGTKSPEAELARAAYNQFRSSLEQNLKQCSSGKELIS